MGDQKKTSNFFVSLLKNKDYQFFLILWTLASGASFTLFIVLVNSVFWKFNFLNSFSLYLICGISIGAAQWLVLKDYLKKSWWWIFTNALGFGLFSLSYRFVADGIYLLRNAWGIQGILFGSVLGLTMGILQWLFLKNRFQKSVWWVLASIGGGVLLISLMQKYFAAFLFGALTGFVLLLYFDKNEIGFEGKKLTRNILLIIFILVSLGTIPYYYF